MKMSQNAITTSTRSWLGSRGRARLGLLAGAVAAVLACEEPKEIGLPPTTPVDISYSDTITITRETIRFDSVRSNDQSNLMVGRYTDPVFGKVQARSYVQSRLATDFVVTDTATTNVTPINRIIYDSTRLVLDLDGFYYGDTTKTQELQIFRLTDSLRTGINYDVQSVVSSESQPLVRQTIRPRPTARDSVNARFSLPDSYGKQILALANTDAGKMVNAGLFNAQFRSGLLISANSADQSAVLGYSPGVVANNTVFGSYIAVYYHVEGEKSRRQQFLLLNGKRFSQITADRAGTPLASLQRGQALLVSATGNRTFVQPATGVTTKLSFPTLTQLVQSGRIAINRADLIITPTTPDDSRLYYPPYLVLAEVDEKNQLRPVPAGGFPYLVPTTGPADRTAGSFIGPQVVARVNRTNSYTFEIGGYFQSITSKLTPNTGLALLTPGSEVLFPTSQVSGLTNATQQYLTDRVWRMTLDGKASVKLVVFYTTSK